MDYSKFRTFIRDIYDLIWEQIFPFLSAFCEWCFMPVGDAIDMGLDALDPVGNNFIMEYIEDLLILLTNTSLGNVSMISLMLGSSLIVYCTYSFAKFILDIIF